MDGMKVALLRRARAYIAEYGYEKFIKLDFHGYACGCMGAQGDEPECPCTMSYELCKRKMELLNHIAPDLALVVMRSNIIKALGGKGL